MATLDLLDYLSGLDDALAAPGPDGRPLLPPALRKPALRETRRALDAMAFRFAVLDERPLPEDLDYLRAIEAVKPAARAAEVLARRRPIYAKARRRRLVTTWTILAVLGLAAGALAYAATSEKADTLVAFEERPAVDVTYSSQRNFTVTDEMTRLRIDGQVFLGRSSQGSVEIRLIDPQGNVRMTQSYNPQSNNWLRENVYDPQPGTWALLVDFNVAHGAVQVNVNGVSPTR